jgi:fucose 4-O-acetylase-like acetyltransferase
MGEICCGNTFYFLFDCIFLVSGYLFANSRPRSFVENFKKKASRLLIPYVSIAVIKLGVKMAFPSLVNVQVGGMGEYIWHFFFE